MPSPSNAQLSVIAEHVDRYRQELADMAPTLQGKDREDLVAALYEAERALRSAERALRRAAKLT